jgi:hypothetical protein
MPQKSLIVDELGERALLLPQRVQEALAANDRVKLRLTLLQAAERHAANPGAPAPDYGAERRAFGLSEPELDALIAETRQEADELGF